jgi:hypothetical protein
LEVDGGEGELDDGAVENLVEGGDSVEEGDVENEGCEEAGEELGGDAFGDVALGVGDLFGDLIAGGGGSAFMLSEGGRNLRWVAPSGVPMANAPFSIPAQKTKPSLDQPVWLFHARQTNSLLA